MDYLAGMTEQLPQHAQQWDGASTVNLMVSLVTLATVIFMAGAVYQKLSTVVDDVKELKRDVKGQGLEQADVRGRLGLPARHTPAE
jgi:predicted DNA-binding ArsR family transcriptional regulator